MTKLIKYIWENFVHFWISDLYMAMFKNILFSAGNWCNYPRLPPPPPPPTPQKGRVKGIAIASVGVP